MSVKEEKKPHATKAAVNSTTGDDANLDQLRQILFGNHSRAIEERLDQLEKSLETTRRDSRNALKQETSTLRQSDEQIQASLSQKLDAALGELAETRKELQELQRTAAEERKQLVRDMQSDVASQVEMLRDAIETMREELIERLLAKQTESRQRDDDLRQELLAVSAYLDSSKPSRSQLGQMLMQVGQQLQENGDNGLQSAERPLKSVDDKS